MAVTTGSWVGYLPLTAIFLFNRRQPSYLWFQSSLPVDQQFQRHRYWWWREVCLPTPVLVKNMWAGRLCPDLSDTNKIITGQAGVSPHHTPPALFTLW